MIVCIRVMSPRQTVDECFFFDFFLPESFDFLRPKYPKNKKTYLAKKKFRAVTGWQGFIEHVCQLSGSYIRKKSCGSFGCITNSERCA